MDGLDALVLGYIDPGTGALVLQMLFAAIVTIGIFGKRLLATLFSFLRRPKITGETSKTEINEVNKRAA